jgi:hypothetical protein
MVLKIPRASSQMSYFQLIREYAHKYLPVTFREPEDYIPLTIIADFLPQDVYKEFVLKMTHTPHINAIELPDNRILVHPDGLLKYITKYNQKHLAHFKRVLTSRDSSRKRS